MFDKMINENNKMKRKQIYIYVLIQKKMNKLIIK